MIIHPDLKDRVQPLKTMGEEQARSLTYGEWASLSTGLAEALRWADATPAIVNKPTFGAKIARLWRGCTPIMAWGDRIYWPGAAEDFSVPGHEHQMAVLQHELQHVLEFATGELSVIGYALNPKNWRYRYSLGPTADWRRFGAEQRASIVEALWRIERGLNPNAEADDHRRVIPWANPCRDV